MVHKIRPAIKTQLPKRYLNQYYNKIKSLLKIKINFNIFKHQNINNLKKKLSINFNFKNSKVII